MTLSENPHMADIAATMGEIAAVGQGRGAKRGAPHFNMEADNGEIYLKAI